MGRLIHSLPIATITYPSDLYIVSQGNPPIAHLCTLEQILAANISSAGQTISQNPRVGPYQFIHSLPLADQVYIDDLIMVDQGVPPITRAATIALVQTAYFNNVVANTELKGANSSMLLSGLPRATIVSAADWVIVNQGHPPVTRRAQLNLQPIPLALSYYTSLIYPYLGTDTMHQPVPSVIRGSQFIMNPDTMHQPVAGIQSGILAVTVSYIVYINKRDVNPDTMNQPTPPIQSGTLAVTINYIIYVNERDVIPDTMNQPTPPIQSGTLVVTISYVIYTNQRDVTPDMMHQSVPPIQSGSLV